MRKTNLVFSAGMGVLSLLVLWWSRDLPSGAVEYGYGPDLYPRLLSWFILGLVALLVIGTFREKENEPSRFKLQQLSLPVALTLMISAYALLMEYLGFIVDTFVFLFASMFALKTSGRKALLLSLAITAIVYLVFKIVLRVPLPKGTLIGG